MSFEDKTIIFLGSSVTCGANGWSMCEYVREALHCNTVKWAVSGTTLADVDENSYVSRLQREIINQQNCDCFICQLSTNDAGRNIPLGEISPAVEKNLFDTKTTAGAMEYIISLVKEKWNCPIIFYTGTYFENEKYQKAVDMLLEINKKWGLEVQCHLVRPAFC